PDGQGGILPHLVGHVVEAIVPLLDRVVALMDDLFEERAWLRAIDHCRSFGRSLPPELVALTVTTGPRSGPVLSPPVSRDDTQMSCQRRRMVAINPWLWRPLQLITDRAGVLAPG